MKNKHPFIDKLFTVSIAIFTLFTLFIMQAPSEKYTHGEDLKMGIAFWFLGIAVLSSIYTVINWIINKIENGKKPSNEQILYTKTLIDRTEEITTILASTIDRNEFHRCFNEFTNIYQSLTGLQESMKIPNDLLNNMRDIIEDKQTYINMLESRIAKLNADYDYMEGHDFERFCAILLEHNGFRNVIVTQGSGDQGIDILAEKDGVKYGIQCKCYSSDIGNKAVQEAFAGKTFYKCHVAAVLTNRYFTKSAKELAEINQVLLWDRDILEKLIQNTNM